MHINRLNFQFSFTQEDSKQLVTHHWVAGSSELKSDHWLSLCFLQHCRGSWISGDRGRACGVGGGIGIDGGGVGSGGGVGGSGVGVGGGGVGGGTGIGGGGGSVGCNGVCGGGGVVGGVATSRQWLRMFPNLLRYTTNN